jgi:hypothetical protein
MRRFSKLAMGFLWIAAHAGCSSDSVKEAEVTGREAQDLGSQVHALTADDASKRIAQRRRKLKSVGTDLGAHTSAVTAVTAVDAYYQTFEHGVIVYSSDFGAVLVSQVILDKWLSLAGQSAEDGTDLLAYVGPPIADIESFATHEQASFERGRIVVQGGVARLITGAIYGHYLALAGLAGLPTAEASVVGAGRSQAFSGGHIFWNPALGAFLVRGPSLDRYLALGGATGTLGFPTGDTSSVVDAGGTEIGASSRFVFGAIFESPATGAWELRDRLLTDYEKRFGGPAGFLGFPIAAQGVSGSGDPFADFQGGVLVDHRALDAYRGVRAFGTLDVFISRLEGFGDDCWQGVCGNQDIYAYVTIDTTARNIVSGERHPGSDDYGTDQKDLSLKYDLGVARSSLAIDVSVSVWDYDSVSSNDRLGVVSDSYSIDNLWGALTDNYHRSGNAAATFAVRNHRPYDRSDFRGARWWSFSNFTTDELSYDQFSRTFVDVSPDESVWLHPFNKLFYELYKGVASNGNCFGMGLQSIYADLNRTPYAQPIHDYFPDTQDGRELADVDSAHAALINEINIKHGYQLGANMVNYTIGTFIGGLTHDPMANFNAAQAADSVGEYPLVSIFDDYLFGSAHSVRPYSFESFASCSWTSAPCARMHIADPNYPTGEPTGASHSDDDVIEIDMVENTYRYRGYSGGTWTGGRMFYQPFHLFSHTPRTPLTNVTELVDNGVLLIVGTTGKTRQISDDAGRTFFEPGLSGLPTRWDQIEDDPAQRVPNLAPVVMTDQLTSTMPMQMFAGKLRGATHVYEVAPAPGLASGTPLEVTFESGKLSSHFVIPGTESKPDKITARSIGTSQKAISLKIPEDGSAKAVSWTVGGFQKQRWAKLDSMNMQPGQEITVRLDNAGFDLVIQNNGPATTAVLTVDQGAGSDPVVVGTIPIEPGTTDTQYELPVTTLTLSNETYGNAGWLIAPVTVTLTARVFTSLGIDVTEHTQDLVNWTTYAGPFVYATEGQSTVSYRTRDRAGNEEAPKSHELRVDTRKPEVTLSIAKPAYTRVESFEVDFTAADPAPGSGLAQVVSRLDAQDVHDADIIDLLWFSNGTHTLRVTALDVAGWSTQRSGSFELTATLTSLRALILALLSRGEIDSEGTARGLLAKVDAASAATARGDRSAALNQLSALLNDVSAQAGKHLSARGAEVLTSDVRYVMAH